MLRTLTTAISVLIAGFGAVSAAELRDGEVNLIERFDGQTLDFEPVSWPKDARGVTLSVSPPEALDREDRKVNILILEFENAVPRVNLTKEVSNLVDGIYGYEISVGTQKQIKKKEIVDNGRGKDSDYDLVSYLVSGSFLIDSGKIVVFAQDEEKGVEDTKPEEPADDRDEGKDTTPEKPEPRGRDQGDEDGEK